MKLAADTTLYLFVEVESIENAYLIAFRQIFIDPIVDPLVIIEDEFEIFGLKEDTLYFLIFITVLAVFVSCIAYKCYRKHKENKSSKLIKLETEKTSFDVQMVKRIDVTTDASHALYAGDQEVAEV